MVREQGIGAILGQETMPAWAVRQVVEDMDREVVARELECFTDWREPVKMREIPLHATGPHLQETLKPTPHDQDRGHTEAMFGLLTRSKRT